MGKTIEAHEVVHENLRFVEDEAGDLTGVIAQVSVVYDGDVRVRREHDVWPLLTQNRKNAMRGFRNWLKQFLHDEYLS